MWLNKPFAIWKIIEPIANKKMERALNSVPAWYRSKKEQYLAALESGEVGLPVEKPYWE